MKRLFLIPLMIVLVSGLIFTGCPAPVPAPAPAPAPVPAPAPAPAPVPAPPEVKPIELRFASHSPPMGGGHLNVCVPWARKVEEVTNSRVKITIYPAETLCKMKEMIEATKGGVADIAWAVAALFPGRFPLTSVSSLPFVNLLSGTVDGRTLTLGGINSHILQELYETFPEIQAEWTDVKLLFLWTCDPYALFTIDKPVRNRADLKGLKIRELGGPPTEMWKLLGAIPLTIPPPGLYEAAEKGVIQAVSFSWSPLEAYKLYEMCRYRTDVATIVGQFAMVMNKEKWNSLPPDIQEAIMSVSGIYGAEFAGEAEWGLAAVQEACARIKEAGYEIEEVSLDPGELEEWKEIAGKPVWDKWVAGMEAKGLPGQKVLDEAFRLIEKYK